LTLCLKIKQTDKKYQTRISYKSTPVQPLQV